MTRGERGRAWWRRFGAPLALAALLVCASLLYAWRLRHNPPGFFVDESSIAYNAYTIARDGRDEFGAVWPLFFRAFGDYKNPVYIYLLAALFKLTGPSILCARLLSAASGVATAALLWRLAARVSGRRIVGLCVGVSALLTPWLFEMSRVVLEVALYPALLVLFLLCLRRASGKDAWSWTEALTLSLTLALLTYAYSIGRLLAPLLALGLVLFATRARLCALVLTWVLYALTLLPMLTFARRHPDALTGRFQLITYITPQMSRARLVREFAKHYAGNLDPRPLLLTGDPNIWQVAHVHRTPLMLAPVVLLSLAGACLAWRHRGESAWWRFVVYATAVSVVPASLTADYFHMLRLAALPVLLLVLTVPAFAWLCAGGARRRAALVALVALVLAQGALFQWGYHASERDAWRRHLFDADYPERIFAAALATGRRPIYLADALTTPYIQAYWYATLRGVPLDDFVRLAPDESPPPGALVISTEESCAHTHVLAQVAPYTLYFADERVRTRAPLAAGAMRAGIEVTEAPARWRAGETGEVRVRVRNLGNAVWLACERSAGRFQVYLASRWLDAEGRMASPAEGRSPIVSDLTPGETAELSLQVNAPAQAGDYLLELDMLQEGVAWFSSTGSQPARLRVRVE